MGYVIQATATRLEDEDFTWMNGKSIREMKFGAPDSWWLHWSGGGLCSIHGGIWRLSRPDALLVSSADHGHKFGLPEPLDAGAVALSALKNACVVEARVDDAMPDLVIRFDNGVVLQVLALSMGYECWELRDPSGRTVVVQGSRHASTYQEPQSA